MTGRRWVMVFAAGVLAVLGALSWVTAHTLRLERSERAASNEARHQELVRLVLWRMDSALTPIIAREAARPYFEYQPFYPVDTRFARQATDLPGKPGAWTGGVASLGIPAAGADTLSKPKAASDDGAPGREDAKGPLHAEAAAPVPTMVPSPLLSPNEPHVKLYFEEDAAGVRTSPQIPQGEARWLADAAYVTEYSLALAQDRLAALNALLNPVMVGAEPPAAASSAAAEPSSLSTANQQPVVSDPAQVTSEEVYKQNINEYRARQQATQFANRVDEPRATARRESGGSQGKEAQAAAQSQPSEGPRSGHAAGTSDGAAADEIAMLDQTKKDLSPPAAAGTETDGSGAAPGERAGEHAAQDPVPVNAVPPAAVVPGSADARVLEEKGRDGREAHGARSKPSAVPPATASDTPGTPSGGGLREAAQEDGRAVAVTSADVSGVSVRQGQFAARWIVRPGQTPELIFEREMDVGDRHFTQGIWLDWPALKQMLLMTAEGLLPSIDLVPILDLASLGPDDLVLGRTLAAIPVELIAPTPALSERGGWTPARTALALMWIAVVGAIIAAGVSLSAAAELAQRRGQFVSAVTHELRTPLTTFCLYSQMLADGIVTDGDAQKGYFQTLKSESMRLARIVESVLDYARLSGRTVTRVATDAPIDSLVASLDRVLRARCEQSGMHLDVRVDAGVRGSIRTDHTIVERVLFNLVENACKYAAEAEDPTIHLRVSSKDSSWLEFEVQDHGPGIDAAERARIFRPFTRGSRQAHGGIPGLGLGLALAQGLARELGGALELKAGGEGACFVFRLPIDAG